MGRVQLTELQAVKAASEMAMVQQPQSAKYAGMPSSAIATVFLDNELKIKRYTERATALFKLISSDVGRPLGDLVSNINYDGLSVDCREVLDTLVFRETEVCTQAGDFYLMRILPYRTADNVIDGLVMTFVNINELKQAQQSGREQRSYFQGIVDTVRQPLVVLDETLRIISCNREFYRTFRTSAKQTEGVLVYNLGSGQWKIPELRQLLETVLPKNASFEDYEVAAEFPKIGRRVFVLNARQLEREQGLPPLILPAMEVVTAY